MWTRSFLPPVILAHHSVGDVEDEQDPRRLVVSPGDLRSQIRALQRLGYRFATSEQLLQDYPPPARTAVLTFDDGWLDSLSTASPLMLDLGVRGAFYVCPGWWDGRHPDVSGPHGKLMGASEVGELHAAGMEIGSHSMSHRDLRKLALDELRNDLSASKEAIEEITGEACRTLAYPFGLFTRREREVAQEVGYELALAWLPGPWERYATPRLPAPPRNGGRRLLLKMWGLRRPVRLS
ncbi:MAG: polysaccharide deacetylase family protein [Actinomycetota bacterium]|nr:polysaccharide deacetylase family protein [Actinomycetota bacterium]